MEYADSVADNVDKWVKRDDWLSEILFRSLAALIVVYAAVTIRRALVGILTFRFKDNRMVIDGRRRGRPEVSWPRGRR